MARELDENKFIFTWKIKNLNILWKWPTGSLKSPCFSVCTSNETRWYLKITNDGIIHIKKTCDNDNDNSIISYILEIRDGIGFLLVSCQFENCLLTKHDLKNKYFIKLTGLQRITEETSVTIQLTLILPEIITDDVYRFKAETEYKIEQSSFVWKVEKFLRDDQDSRIFTCSEWVDFYVKLSKSERFVQICIETLKQEHLFCFLDCKIALLDNNGAEEISETEERIFLLPERSWKFPDFIETSYLANENSKCIKYDMFSLKLEFCVSSGVTFQDGDYCSDSETSDWEPNDSCTMVTTSKSEHTNCMDSVANLQENFRRMYMEHLQTDVELQAGKETFQAHKFILLARSPVLADLLKDQEVLENRTCFLYFPDMEPEILDIFLRFMYDGLLENMDYDSAAKLLVSADEFQVPSLKQKCSTFLMTNLDEDNACDVLILAHKIELDTLKASAANYIVEHADIILQTEEWSKLLKSNMDLAMHIMRDLSIV